VGGKLAGLEGERDAKTLYGNDIREGRGMEGGEGEVGVKRRW